LGVYVCSTQPVRTSADTVTSRTGMLGTRSFVRTDYFTVALTVKHMDRKSHPQCNVTAALFIRNCVRCPWVIIVSDVNLKYLKHVLY